MVAVLRSPESVPMPNNLVLPGSAGSGMAAVSRGPGAGLSASSVISSLSPEIALAVLLLSKLSRVAAAFLSYYYLQSPVALPIFLLFVSLGASVCLLILQRPWNGRRIGSKRFRKIFIAGVVLTLMLYLWSAGLRSAGPLRTLLIDGAELPLLYIYAVVSGRELPERRKTRGAFLMLCSYALVVWDASGQAPNLSQLEQTRLAQKAEDTLEKVGNLTAEKLHVMKAHGLLNPEAQEDIQAGGRRRTLLALDTPVRHKARRRAAEEKLMGDDSKPGGDDSNRARDLFVEGSPIRSEIGVLLVLAASVVMQASRPFTRRLCAELGGAKRQFALTVTSAGLFLWPFALLSHISPFVGNVLSMRLGEGGGVSDLNASRVTGFTAVGFLWLVLPYYIRSMVSASIDQGVMLQYGLVVPFFLASIASVIFGFAAHAGGVSWILIAAFLLDFVGLSMMVAGGGAKRGLSELPLDSRTSGSSANGATAATSRAE